MTHSARIADQFRRAYEGDAWHGPALLELLKDVDLKTAVAKPIAGAHSIWEIVLHIAAWDEATLRRLEGHVSQPDGDENFPPVPKNPTERDWKDAVAAVKATHDRLVREVAALPDSRLSDMTPGKNYDFYHQLHGVVQHELYHAGQVALLKKAAAK